MNILLSIAIALAAGLAVSRLIRLIHLPNVTAFLIAGLLIGPSVLGILTEEATLALDSFTTVALGFIAYSIGGEFKLSYLKEIGVRPIVITLFEGLTAAVAVFGVMWALGFDLALCLALGAIATATAPAATLMVVRQYKAKGPVCATLLPVVAMDDALCLMCFSICSAIAAAAHQRPGDERLGHAGQALVGNCGRFGSGHGHRLCGNYLQPLFPLPGQ